jgi:hypothetical protein
VPTPQAPNNKKQHWEGRWKVCPQPIQPCAGLAATAAKSRPGTFDTVLHTTVSAVVRMIGNLSSGNVAGDRLYLKPQHSGKADKLG